MRRGWFDHPLLVAPKRHQARSKPALRPGTPPMLIGDISRREEQRPLLAVVVGELMFQKHVVMAGPGNVARPARAGSDVIDSLMHRCDHRRMLAHAQIIVGTPDSNLIFQMVEGLRKVAGASLEV